MKKKFWLRVVESCAFLLLLGAVVISVSGLMERKYSRDLFGGFLEEPEAYDVLFFGDSQFMNAMLPLEMWEDYGIAGYNLACYGNVLPVSYWAMINALDYAQPKLVVLAANAMNEEHKVSNYSGDLHTALDFWPLTKNKVRMLDDLLDDPEDPDFRDVEGNLYRELKWEYLFPIGKYHSRWSELTQDDFRDRPAYVKGGESLVGVHSIWDYELVGEDDYAEESGYSYVYLRKAIEECQSRGIEVLLVHLPAPEYVNSQRHANTVGSVATEYGVDFIDVTYLDSIVDYVVDCCDSEPHLNMSGTQKMTAFLGSYLRDHFDLPDRREEPAYAHWRQHIQDYKDEKIRVLSAEEKLNNVLMLLHDKDFDVSIAMTADSPIYYDDQAIVLMHNIAREQVLSGEEEEKWSNAMFPLEGFDEALYEGLPYYMERTGENVTEYVGSDAEQAAAQALGGFEESSVLIRAIDRRDGSVAAQMRF